MRKRHIFSKAWILLLLPIFSACEKFIDLEPKSTYSFNSMWKTEADANAAINAMYNTMRAFDANYIYWGEGRGDMITTVYDFYKEAKQLKDNNLTSTMSTADWSALYKTISIANFAIKYAPNIKMSVSSINKVRGQAFFARALCYFYIARVWGKAPLILQPTDDASMNMEVSQEDPSKILDQVVTDCDSANVMLPEVYESETQWSEWDLLMRNRIYATKAAVWALQTDVYMWLKKYDLAENAAAQFEKSNRYYDKANDVWKLHPDVKEIHRRRIKENKYPAEVIFEVYFNEKDGAYSSFKTLFEVEWTHTYMATPKYLSLLKPGDQRIDLIKYYPSNGQYIAKRFPFDDSRWSMPTDQPVVLYRLTDILLLRAEALNKLGRKDEAIKFVNVVRKRANLEGLKSEDFTSVDALEDAILNERAVELIAEGKRYFDLVRTGKAASVLNITNPNNLYWPVYYSNLKENPKLVQNPYYVTE